MEIYGIGALVSKRAAGAEVLRWAQAGKFSDQQEGQNGCIGQSERTSRKEQVRERPAADRRTLASAVWIRWRVPSSSVSSCVTGWLGLWAEVRRDCLGSFCSQQSM